MRIGVFGGTFDPPHLGHLLAASDALEVLALDRLTFVPNAAQPLKPAPVASGAQRLEMVRLLVGEDPRFGVDPAEVEREGVSYTVETLATYAERHPRDERFLLIGADVVPTLGQWRDTARIRTLAEIVALRRPEGGGGAAQTKSAGDGIRWLDTRHIEISSRELRARVKAGLPIRGFVPDAIAAYIAATGLYR